MGLKLRVTTKKSTCIGLCSCIHWVGWRGPRSQSWSPDSQGQPGIQVLHRRVPAWMQSPVLATRCQGIQEHNSIREQSRVLLNEWVWCQKQERESNFWWHQYSTAESQTGEGYKWRRSLANRIQMSGSFCLSVAASWKWQYWEPSRRCCRLSREESPLKGGPQPLSRFQCWTWLFSSQLIVLHWWEWKARIS